jgi:hypothetical protein
MNSPKSPDDSSTKTILAILGVILAVPAAVFALFQISDRVDSDSQSSSPTSTSAHSATPETSSPDHSPTTPRPTTDVPDPPTSIDPPSGSEQPPSTTIEAPPPIPVVDRIQISTWAYDKAGLNTYIADNNGGKSIRVSWTASANGYEVNGGCASSVRIQGPGTEQAKNSSNCSDSMGTYLDVQQPGNYTVTVTTRQDSGAEHSENITVTVLPG